MCLPGDETEMYTYSSFKSITSGAGGGTGNCVHAYQCVFARGLPSAIFSQVTLFAQTCDVIAFVLHTAGNSDEWIDEVRAVLTRVRYAHFRVSTTPARSAATVSHSSSRHTFSNGIDSGTSTTC
jgi:hypothetical protein